MTVTDTQVTWLTQEAYGRLKAELDELIANRPVIAAEINARREEGDLKENGGYHAAREEQGQQEARIRQLQELLRTAQVGTAPTSSDVAQPGTGPHLGDPGVTAPARRLHHVSRLRAGRAHEQRGRGVAVEAAELRRHVDVDDVAVGEALVGARDAVTDDGVAAGAHGGGKAMEAELAG